MCQICSNPNYITLSNGNVDIPLCKEHFFEGNCWDMFNKINNYWIELALSHYAKENKE